MRFIISMTVLAVALVGCSSSSAPAPPTPTVTSVRGGATGIPPVPHATRTARPVSVVVVSGFATAVRSLCTALTRKDSSAVTSALPYYQYNSGLRYGVLGDGEGQTGDPGLMANWLAHSSVRCVLHSSGDHGHGTVLATGWHQPGGSALIEFDTYSGRWKINDFTFGPYGALYRALQTARPVVRYAG